MGGRTKELPIPIEETYRDLLREAVRAAGGQGAAAKLAGIHQTTIGRTLRPGARATYTTMLRLSAALKGLPAPVVAVRDEQHERWCRLGAQLQVDNPEVFGVLLNFATVSLSSPLPPVKPSDEALERLRSVIANPFPNGGPRRSVRR